MRFLIIVKSTPDIEAGRPPSEKGFADMQAYNEEMLRAGVFLDGQGLHPSSQGFRVHLEDDEQIITDGPFAEAKELIAGFTMIEVASREEAIEWVKKWPHSPEDGVFDLEVRRVYELEELAENFGDEFTPELLEREKAMRDEAERNGARG